ncbi:hypothetical protein ADL27_37440, partial [Streptomyces sp. NRRL F-6602]
MCVPHRRRCPGPNRRVRIAAACAPDPTHDREGTRIGGRHRHHRHSGRRRGGFDLPLRTEGAARP